MEYLFQETKQQIWPYITHAYLQKKNIQLTHAIAVITNGASDLQRLKLEKAGLIELFPESAIIVSSEIGIGRPHEKIYREAVKRLDREVWETVIIEDRPRNIQGAQNIGMKGILVDNRNSHNNLPVIRVGSLHEVIPFLKK